MFTFSTDNRFTTDGRTRTARMSARSAMAFDAGGRRRRTNPIAECLPVRAHFGDPWHALRQRQVQRITHVLDRTGSRPRDVIDDPGADIESHDLCAGRGRQTEPIERVEDAERLERLLRVDVEAHVLVREVQPRTNDRHASHRAWREQSPGLYRGQRLLHRVVGHERRVERQAAGAEQT